jgi:hypothetical protein
MAQTVSDKHRNLPTVGEDYRPLDGDSELEVAKKKAKREREESAWRNTQVKELQLFANASTLASS